MSNGYKLSIMHMHHVLMSATKLENDNYRKTIHSGGGEGNIGILKI